MCFLGMLGIAGTATGADPAGTSPPIVDSTRSEATVAASASGERKDVRYGAGDGTAQQIVEALKAGRPTSHPGGAPDWAATVWEGTAVRQLQVRKHGEVVDSTQRGGCQLVPKIATLLSQLPRVEKDPQSHAPFAKTGSESFGIRRIQEPRQLWFAEYIT